MRPKDLQDDGRQGMRRKDRPQDSNFMQCVSSVVDVICLSGPRRARAKRGGMCIPRLVFSASGQIHVVASAPSLVIGGQVPQVYMWLQISTNERLGKKRIFDMECGKRLVAACSRILIRHVGDGQDWRLG